MGLKNIGHAFYYIFVIIPRWMRIVITRKDRLGLHWKEKKDSYWEDK